MASYDYFVVDAFAYEPFTGNPAAVVLAAGGLDDGLMQRIAAEFNLSETTFVLPAEPDPDGAPSVRFRWFTPTTEVDMCGHATVAGVHALVTSGFIAKPGPEDSIVLRIRTKSGPLTAFVESLPGDPGRGMIWLEMIPPVLAARPTDVDELAGVLGLAADVFDESLPPVETQDRDVLVFVRDAIVLNDSAPDSTRLGGLLSAAKLRGLCLATTRTVTPTLHVQSRFFAPTAGVPEDPVTGSVHGPLAVYLARNGRAPSDGETFALTCGQAVRGGRGGLLHALVQLGPAEAASVRIGGRAFGTMRGQILV